mmetsp:Transcript_19896/g.28602  ORF Transcript_19896/g.28602 Transcript_19896/m.28602 type:complete len:502 (-) Transcript_19896:249-1754(-)|eukprot:CAMPEP_0185019312 /NCGR_PEP_ID=MMETSP1103-20130426/1913_1 /TAXON_ID=36769 /ORGANISM="Paraphysomonas bandaiensis, Strain Caron Lab Isolate" /LENGTH=501 /DNA_ID=CAMNT_0027549535 /DNA_START=100 /DNA_END=1605 /DNA_ORIENTATION=-
MDPLWHAMSKLRRGKLDECIEICNQLLTETPGDQATWLVRCKAVTRQNYLDDIELDEESIADIVMDENAVASMPRPGTSLSTPQVGRGTTGFDQGVRPVSQSGRPVTGFSRPTSSRPMSGASVRDTLQSSRRSGTARPMTTLGREMRLGTASLSSSTMGPMVDVERFNVAKYATRTGLAMAVVDYLLYVEHNTRKALELCAEATKACDFKDWWWKAKLGKCYYKIGLLREAEQQMRSSIRAQPIVNTYLELCNVYLRLDLPNTALDLLSEASSKFSAEPRLLLGMARIYDALNDPANAIVHYKKVLSIDASNIESIACLGAHFFYSDQPEVSIRYFRRLLQMGVNSAELWNNLGLSCFYAAQYDMALNCFDRALSMASDDCMPDIWYNIGHIGVALGDLGMAYQAFKVTVSIDPSHGEAHNNIAVLEMRRQKTDLAKSCIGTAIEVGPHLFEPLYNSALFAFRSGEFQEAFNLVTKALSVYPNHSESKELKENLEKLFGAI